MLYLLVIVVTLHAIQDVHSMDPNFQVYGQTTTVLDRNIDFYLGIPYAKPPVGVLRFRKPVPYEYTKPINATQWHNSCLQMVQGTDDNLGIGNGINKVFSEDCLYLNVWAPQPSSGASPAAPKSVMVWLYPGGFTLGSSAVDLFNAEVVAALGDVVVVTFNYRLNVFGFLYGGSDEAPGNVGLWDQVLALQWVQSNIARFGGDPNRVTLFGDSSGSMSASIFTLSPVTRHLFRNAILMSGSALIELSQSRELSLQKWLKLSKVVNCGDGKQFGANDVACLRTIPSDVLFKSFVSILSRDFFSPTIGLLPLITYGDQLLPRKPIEMLKSGDIKRDLNLLMGTTDDEGSQFLSLLFGPELNLMNPLNLTKFQANQLLLEYSSRASKKSSPLNGADISRVYLSQIPPNNVVEIRRAVSAAVGDYTMTCPSILYASYAFKTDITRNKVFQYVFSAKTESITSWCPKIWGACHNSDLVMVFGLPFRQPKSFTDSERLVSKSMVNAFTHFAKYDKPPAQEEVEWSPYYAINNNTDIIQPYYQYLFEQKVKGNFDINYKDIECEKLWKKSIELDA